MEQVSVLTLIDKAKTASGSDYKTAKALGVSPQVVSDWRHARRPVPPEDIALLAEVAGMDPTAWLVRGVLEKHQGTAKGDRLIKALGKGLLVTGAAIASSGAAAAAIFSRVEPSHLVELVRLGCSTMYIM